MPLPNACQLLQCLLQRMQLLAELLLQLQLQFKLLLFQPQFKLPIKLELCFIKQLIFLLLLQFLL